MLLAPIENKIPAKATRSFTTKHKSRSNRKQRKKNQNLKKNKKFNTNKEIQSSPQAQIADFKTQTLNLVFFFLLFFFVTLLEYEARLERNLQRRDSYYLIENSHTERN